MTPLQDIAAEMRNAASDRQYYPNMATDVELLRWADALDAAAKDQAAELYEAHCIAQRDNDALLAQAAEIERLRETIERIKERATAGAKQFRYATDYTVILDLIEARIPELKDQA